MIISSVSLESGEIDLVYNSERVYPDVKNNRLIIDMEGIDKKLKNFETLANQNSLKKISFVTQTESDPLSDGEHNEIIEN